MLLAVWTLNTDDPAYDNRREYRLGYAGKVIARMNVDAKKRAFATIDERSWQAFKNTHKAEKWILEELTTSLMWMPWRKHSPIKRVKSS